MTLIFLHFLLKSDFPLNSLYPKEKQAIFCLLESGFHALEKPQRMSCNGCRVLRKGCSDDCMLRQSLQWIDSSEAQANATVFLSKFFGRAGLMSFISSVPQRQRPSLFQSLLFEAVGRAANPVSGAVGLLWTGNWHLCQTAVLSVLHNGAVKALPEFEGRGLGPEVENVSERASFRPKQTKRKRCDDDLTKCGHTELDLSLIYQEEKQQAVTPWEESGTASGSEDNCGSQKGERKLLRLFV